ncbi:uncharacterized protein [Parasteatoda tepidariorum]|uniref:uncharacterized protein n=1 Tax=Parasteatoda tepidariorum TaxID=114398 RepID=UPI00077F869C|nr:uncharacterized protein LOC107436478 [Parasteatoda tepidariorum]
MMPADTGDVECVDGCICVPLVETSLYKEGDSCDKSTFDSYCQKNICFDSEVFGGRYIRKSKSEVEEFSMKNLKILIRNLSKAVEEISGQLVELLVENDALQQESDARNVAIEQLLRMTVKETENELKPVQMSVILTPDNV